MAEGSDWGWRSPRGTGGEKPSLDEFLQEIQKETGALKQGEFPVSGYYYNESHVVAFGPLGHVLVIKIIDYRLLPTKVDPSTLP